MSELETLTRKMEDKLQEIEADPIYQAKPASISINAPKALMQASLYAQRQLLLNLLGCDCQDPANGLVSNECPIHG